MKKKIKVLSIFLLFILLSSLFLSGCGNTPDQPSDNDSQQNTSWDDSRQPDISPSGSSIMPSSAGQTEKDLPGRDAENVIEIGLMGHAYDEIQKMAGKFNMSQSQYQVNLKQYDNPTSLVTDIIRGQGVDILSLYDVPVNVLTQKGILEDLTPYFDTSDVVKREDVVSAVWEAGFIGDEMTCLIPSFTFEGIVVEKGHTQEGGWTVEDYLALAEAYPEGMINQDIKNPINLFLNDLQLAPERYIDWETGTSSFDSSDFVAFLKELTKYSEKQYSVSPNGTPAERLYKREYLTFRAQISGGKAMDTYLQLKTLLGDEFELAGYPGISGEPYYRMIYKYALGMNALSPKKEAAWAFLEYLLSESVQEEYATLEIPARLDVLEHILQDAIELSLNENVRHAAPNPYTQEMDIEWPDFTEEDGQTFLEMLDHVKRFSVMTSGEVAYILLNELKLYFGGDKTAEDVAALIQNRVQLYLDEAN